MDIWACLLLSAFTCRSLSLLAYSRSRVFFFFLSYLILCHFPVSWFDLRGPKVCVFKLISRLMYFLGFYNITFWIQVGNYRNETSPLGTFNFMKIFRLICHSILGPFPLFFPLIFFISHDLTFLSYVPFVLSWH